MLNWFDNKTVSLIGGSHNYNIKEAGKRDLIIGFAAHPIRFSYGIDVLYNPGWSLWDPYVNKQLRFKYMMLAVGKRYFFGGKPGHGAERFGVNFCENNNIPIFLHQRMVYNPQSEVHSDFMMCTDMCDTTGVGDYVPLAGILCCWVMTRITLAKEVFLTGFDFYENISSKRPLATSHQLEKDKEVLRYILQNDSRFKIEKSLEKILF